MTAGAPFDGSGGEGERSDRRLFWRAQVGGWIAFGLIYYLAILPQSPFPAWSLLGFKMVWAATGLLVSTVLALCYRALRLGDRSLRVAVGIGIGLATITAILWVLGLGLVALVVMGSTGMLYTASSFPFVASNHVFILLAWSGGYLALVYRKKAEAQQRAFLAAQGLAREAQLEMLRYQLNPHFLFNAMTSARALVVENPERARETLTRLADFLRYALARRDRLSATLAEEIDTVRNYLAIEQIRFEERLDVAVEVDPCAAAESIPSFLLHPLVENAVKYGTPNDGRLRIAVRAAVTDGRLRIEVANTGRLDPDAGAGTRIGLRNVRERLAATWPGAHEFDLRQDGEWVRAVITVPIASRA